MNVTAESYGRAVILSLKGELTEDSLQAFERVVDHQLESGAVIDLLLNVEKVPFVDSPALEYLLDLQDRLAQKLGQVKLIGPDENVQRILEITRLAPSFEIFKDNAEAVKTIHTVGHHA